MPGKAEYVVRIPESTVEANDAVATHVAGNGTVLTFDSREPAEAVVRQLTKAGDPPVALQAAAPQDPSGVDAYLVARPERGAQPVSGSVDEGLTFETTPAQYGRLGETLLWSHGTDPPPVVAYAKADLSMDRDPHVELRPVSKALTARPSEGGSLRRWLPDSRAVVRARADGPPIREYLIEVKTGQGSLLRDQLAVMRAAADRHAVLVARVDIEGLPESYSVDWRSVDPPDPEAENALVSSEPSQRSLQEFD